MKIYQYKTESNELIKTFENVISWGFNFVEYDNGNRCKVYCSVNEIFSENMINENNANEE